MCSEGILAKLTAIYPPKFSDMRHRICTSIATLLISSASHSSTIAGAMSTGQSELGKVEKFRVTSINNSGPSSKNTCASHTTSVHRVHLDDDGTFPNNGQYPALILKSVFDGTQDEGVKRIIKNGQWTTPWAWGIFEYHHYHSKAWELLLCVRGEALVQLGGSTGPAVSISCGDSVLIPPGVAHKQLKADGSFTLLGAYPTQDFDGLIDTLTGLPTPEQRDTINACYVPLTEPITGLNVKDLFNTPRLN